MMLKKGIKKKCKNCNRTFITVTYLQLFCSENCRIIFNKKKKKENNEDKKLFEKEKCSSCSKKAVSYTGGKPYCNEHYLENIPNKKVRIIICRGCGITFKTNHKEKVFCTSWCSKDNRLNVVK